MAPMPAAKRDSANVPDRHARYASPACLDSRCPSNLLSRLSKPVKRDPGDRYGLMHIPICVHLTICSLRPQAFVDWQV